MPKILVVIDPEETEQPALNRIKEIPVDNIQIKVDYYFQPMPVLAEEASNHHFEIEARCDWLETLVKPFREMGYQIETQIQSYDRLYEAIIQSASAYQADFIFKPLRQHGLLKRTFITSTDWNLIRFCSCPLLLVSHANSLNGSPVLAAVDIATRDDAHQKLNKIVLDQARMVAGAINSEIHLVNAYNLDSVQASTVIADPMACQLTIDKREGQRKEAYQTAKICALPSANVHYIEGAADIVVNKCAADIGAGIIVLGTVARAGVAGLFIGNTAESVMEKTHCDVFVVKQDRFEARIRAA